MQFSFDEQQLEFRAQVRALAEKLCSRDALRDSWQSSTGWSRQRWGALAELGVAGMTVPDSHGGLGLGLVDLVLVLEEAGHAGLPEPLLDTVAVGVPLLVGAGVEVADAWLGRVAAGSAVLGVADPGQPSTVVAGVDVALVWHDGALVVVDPASSSASSRTIDGARRLWTVDSRGPSTTTVAEGQAAAALAESSVDRGATAAAAVLVGVAQRMLTMAADYAGQRVQFGRPIGSFQAVKHHLADAAVRLEFARPLVYRAAWSIDEADPLAGVHASMAKAAASDAATVAARLALQVHGAIGYTWEHDLHLWMKRAWVLAAAWGDAGWHRARVLDLLPSDDVAGALSTT